MLQAATAQDIAVIEALWLAEERYIDPPEPLQIAAAANEGLLFVWQFEGRVAGFAALKRWHPGVFSLAAVVSTVPGQGRALVRAVQAQVFTALDGHRLGLDTTYDNARALHLFEICGFIREGVMRECWQRPDGEWADCIFMAILARDWQL
ncbi:N-acetyltransferase [Cypionkella aquatica]|uniref:N-acetyltransferase n=1 Tax=Cypionkella aquatica TaxID=1756042 RepID=A0AA37U6M7_9RHOB|nr:GNAT family N-acetyltransferase [Cypionkella aquatica]GLS87775.1 N-acetyltransferase [Cypionkella aquatica]